MDINKKLEKHGLDKDFFIKVAQESKSAAQAATKLNLKNATYKRLAIELDCYKTNQCGKGISKKSSQGFELSEILEGKQPQYSTNKLKKRLYKEGIKEEKCEVCGIIDWQGKKISFELHHIDGNSRNHKLENLQIICPNCHSQTESFSGKKTHKKEALTNDEKNKIIEDIQDYNLNEFKIKEPFIKKNKKIKKLYQCEICGQQTENKKYCSYECMYEDRKKSHLDDLDIKDLKNLFNLNNNSMVKVAKMFGLSNNGLKKWFKRNFNLKNKQDIVNFLENN